MLLLWHAWYIETAPCAQSDFTCAIDTTCIPLSKVCDGHSDCPDKADEWNCTNGNNNNNNINNNKNNEHNSYFFANHITRAYIILIILSSIHK